MPIRTERYRSGRFLMVQTTFEASNDPRAIRRRAYFSLLLNVAAVGILAFVIYSAVITGRLTVPALLAEMWMLLNFARYAIPQLRRDYSAITGRPELASDDDSTPLELARARHLPTTVLVLAGIGIAIFVLEAVNQIVRGGGLSFTTTMVLILLGLFQLLAPYFWPMPVPIPPEAQDDTDSSAET